MALFFLGRIHLLPALEVQGGCQKGHHHRTAAQKGQEVHVPPVGLHHPRDGHPRARRAQVRHPPQETLCTGHTRLGHNLSAAQANDHLGPVQRGAHGGDGQPLHPPDVGALPEPEQRRTQRQREAHHHLDTEAHGADAVVVGMFADEGVRQGPGGEGAQEAPQLQPRHPHRRLRRRHRLLPDQVQQRPAGHRLPDHVHPEVGHCKEPHVGALEALLVQDLEHAALILCLGHGRLPLALGGGVDSLVAGGLGVVLDGHQQQDRNGGSDDAGRIHAPPPPHGVGGPTRHQRRREATDVVGRCPEAPPCPTLLGWEPRCQDPSAGRGAHALQQPVEAPAGQEPGVAGAEAEGDVHRRGGCQAQRQHHPRTRPRCCHS
mmetsp:Transcript_12535/g.37650  ORF Transcript_12535/g.37650 Transcript_12535/m.37650 type:complete len:374 (+) Transcript_12535:494-1615(+)